MSTLKGYKAKVKIQDEDCLTHFGDAKCCDCDLYEKVLDAEVMDDYMFFPYPVEVTLPNGKTCSFSLDDVSFITEGN